MRECACEGEDSQVRLMQSVCKGDRREGILNGGGGGGGPAEAVTQHHSYPEYIHNGV